MSEPKQIVLSGDGRVPNSRLPVLLYAGTGPRNAEEMLRHFSDHGWGAGWRNGIYPFHHFHSTAHEVLGIASGQVTVRLGGESGRDIVLHAGDIVVLPAGTGHKRVSASPDLDVVGAYPEGRDWDLLRADEIDDAGYRDAIERIAAVPHPESDPVFGKTGPLVRLWSQDEKCQAHEATNRATSSCASPV